MYKNFQLIKVQFCLKKAICLKEACVIQEGIRLIRHININNCGCPFVRVYVTLSIAKIVVFKKAGEEQRKLCEAQPRKRGAFGATNA